LDANDLSTERNLRTTLHVAYGRGLAVEFGDGDGEGFGVGTGHITKNAERDGFPEAHGDVAVAPPVDAGMDSVAEGDVVCELVQFAIDGERSVAADSRIEPVRLETGAVRGGYLGIGKDVVAIEEEFEDGDAGSRNSAMARGIGRMCGRSFGKSLRLARLSACPGSIREWRQYCWSPALMRVHSVD
jgi:hypothetical protein